MISKIDSAIKWYRENQSLFASLANKVADIITENLEQRKIQYHSVTRRGKSLESFTNKAKSEKYTNPINEIKDMAGVRVITYLESDVKNVADIIEGLFDIDKDNSLDQSKLLGSDKLGYRSVHYVAKFNKTRCKLPENKKYEDLPFEIQIRSILQHAWAEIEHDRNYKFGGKLPTELERRFYLVAGTLESADREFVSISEEIDKYKTTVVQELKRGDLDIEINTTSLKEYLSSRFSGLIEDHILMPQFGPNDVNAKKIIEEIRNFGISNLSQLDRIIPTDLEDNIRQLKIKILTFASIMRTVLITNDVKKYFKDSWRHNWSTAGKDAKRILKKYDVDLAYLQQYVDLAP